MTGGDRAIWRLNELDAARIEGEFLRCFGSSRWARSVAARAPFADRDAVFAAAEEAWEEADRDDWLAAIAGHPRIGEGEESSERLGATGAWSRSEQAGVGASSKSTAARLSVRQRDYEERFGHIFLISAADRSGEEILAALEARLENDPDAELEVAAEELRKIATLRLDKLLVELDAKRVGG